MKAAWMILGVFGVLILAAFFIPSNTITGKVVDDGTCKGVGCLKLCDLNTTNTCDKGTVCCFTHWNTGVCDYNFNCEKIREYSLYQTLDVYNDTMQQQPALVQLDGRFFIALLLIIGILTYFMLKRKAVER